MEATAQLLADLCQGLVKQGHEIVIITASPSLAERSPSTPSVSNPRVIRLGADRKQRTGLLGKAISYFQFSSFARRILRSEVRNNDVVVAMTDPPLLGSTITPTVLRLGGRMWHWSQDLYPEVALAIRPFGPLSCFLRIFRGPRDQSWIRSEGIVAIGTDMKDRIVSSDIPSEKIHVVPNWAPSTISLETKVNHRKEWNILPEDFTLVYSGNLGRAHVLSPLMELAEKCRNQDRLKMLIIGRGAQLKQLKSGVQQRKLKNIRFLAPVPLNELGGSLRAADIHLITMRPDCVGTVWPSKFYGIVAAGRPMVFIGPLESEIAEIIKRESLGVAVSPDNLPAAHQFIESLASDPESQQRYRQRVLHYAKNSVGLSHAIMSWSAIAEGKQSTQTRPLNNVSEPS